MSMPFRRPLTMVLVGVALCVVCVLSASASGSGARASVKHRISQRTLVRDLGILVPARSRVASRQLIRHFGILRRAAASSADPLPATFAAHLAPEVARLGLDLGMTRMASPAAGVDLWLIPGSDGACVVGQINGSDGGASCGPNRPNLALIGYSESNPTDQLVLGFVPDGNPTVTATETDGTTIVATVTDNAFVIRAPDPADLSTLASRDESGAPEAVPIGMSAPR
jgi:hypothetical protein